MEILSVLCLLVFSQIAVDASIRVERAVSCPYINDFSGRVKYRRKGTRAVFKCPKKLTRYGAKFATCKMDGTWSADTPLCTKIGCVPLDPSLVTNLDMNVVNGAVVEFSCLENYLLIGETQAHCNGKDWSAPLPRCAAPHELTECDFEQDLCGWVQDDTDDQDWIRNVGPTQTGNTGPKHDHTYGDTRSGHYLFFETSNPTMTGHQANLISTTYTADMSPMCFDFWYHILGPDEAGHVGSLEVFVLDDSQFIDDDDIQPLFVKEGNQGDSWHRGEIFIDKQDEPYQINIIATRALSYISDIAIDDLRLYNCSSTSTTRTSVTTTPTTTPPLTTTASTTKTTTLATTTVTSPTTTATTSPTKTATFTTPPSASDSTTAIYHTTETTHMASTTKAAVTSSSTSSTTSTIMSTAKPISSTTTLSKQSASASQVSSRSSTTSAAALTTSESSGPDHTMPTHDTTTTSAAAVTTTELSATTTMLLNTYIPNSSTRRPAKTTAKPTTPSSTTMTTTTAITSPSSSFPSVRSTGTTRKPTAATASSTVILSLKTSAPTAQPDSKSTTRTSTWSSSVSMTTKSSLLSTLSTVYSEMITGLSTLTTTPTSPTVTSASTTKQTTTEGTTDNATISPTTYTQTITTETLSTSSIKEQTTIKQYPTHTTQAIKSTKSTNVIPTKSPAKSTKRANVIPTKSPAKSTKQANGIPTKSPAKSTKRTNALTTKSQIATKTTKSNSISVSQQRSQHPADDTIKPLMIGLGVGILTGLIVIGVVAYVCVRRRKFYISRYEDELKPFTNSTNSGSNQSLNNEHYYQDEESES